MSISREIQGAPSTPPRHNNEAPAVDFPRLHTVGPPTKKPVASEVRNAPINNSAPRDLEARDMERQTAPPNTHATVASGGRAEPSVSKQSVASQPQKPTHSLEEVYHVEGIRLPLKDLGVMDLRKELKKRGLSPSGLKVRGNLVISRLTPL